MPIEHSKPTLGKKEQDALIRVLKSNFIAQGRQVASFEQRMCSYIGSVGAVAVSSGTLALHMGLVALGVGKNDEVIIPSYICRSVLNAILYCRAKPVLCDVDIKDYNISFQSAKKKITNNTKAIIVAHMFGHPVNMDKFNNLDIPIIEDCAHSIGAEFRNRKVGSLADISIFSFEGTKYIVTGEGGMVMANKTLLVKKLRTLKESDSLHPLIKLTYKMTDMQAAIGMVQLARIDSFINRRRAIAKKYNAAFSNLDVTLPVEPEYGRHVFHRYMIRIKKDIKLFIKLSEKAGVKIKQPVKPYPIHKILGFKDKDFPVTSSIMNSAVSIPIYPSLKDGQIKKIIRTVKQLII